MKDLRISVEVLLIVVIQLLLLIIHYIGTFSQKESQDPRDQALVQEQAQIRAQDPQVPQELS
jgi:sensor histidine kinase regulating citrate/malate metabolism